VGWWNPWSCEQATNLWFNSPGHTNEVTFDAARRLVYMSAGASQVVVVDVANPAAPILRGQFRAVAADQAAWGLEVAGDVMFAAYIAAFVPYRGTWAGIRAIGTVR
jgi:hypothetical protein